MDRTPRSHPVLLVMVVLVGWALLHAVPSHAPSWQLHLEISDLRVSVAIGAAPVRNRTALFDIGQVATLLKGGR